MELRGGKALPDERRHNIAASTIAESPAHAYSMVTFGLVQIGPRRLLTRVY